ncbi:hypothetical protein N8T08_000488 [Aspergillus melleus]|uniref:Uncharacterized protein n=1 Tax=Aspergillus melleus TaxID=138277 RepID=A0ACC3BBI4_9EURO|nr:hypothetical protein N8T08_000488 [Aspergillus melleus]
MSCCSTKACDPINAKLGIQGIQATITIQPRLQDLGLRVPQHDVLAKVLQPVETRFSQIFGDEEEGREGRDFNLGAARMERVEVFHCGGAGSGDFGCFVWLDTVFMDQVGDGFVKSDVCGVFWEMVVG